MSQAVSMDIVELVNICGFVVANAISLILTISVFSLGNLRKKIFKYFFITVFSMLIYSFCEIIMWLGRVLIHTDWMLSLTIGADTAIYLASAAQMFYVALYFYEYISTKTKPSKTPFYLISACAVVGAVLIIIVKLRGTHFQMDPDQNFELQSSVMLLQAIVFIVMISYIYFIFKYKSFLSRREFISTLLYLLISLIAHIMVIIVPGLYLDTFAVSIAIYIIYAGMQRDIKVQLEKKEREAQVAIMLSQIQPHFLYNSLSAIAYECRDNKEAEETVNSFSRYLRANMDSLTEKNLIPFNRELEHVKNYLKIEKLRFGENLEVEYKIETEDFMLPPLTVQPIAENAVRHGLSKKRGVGTLLIATFEDESNYTIRIKDNGIGFDINGKASDERSHVGISNVRYRLETMCEGTLEIVSEIGTGTTATIKIPKKR